MIEQFKTNLDVTRRWCWPRFSMRDLPHTLRSPELRPKKNIVHDVEGLDEIQRIVDDVIARREFLLGTEAVSSP